MDKFVIRSILVLGYYCSFINFDYIYAIDISIPTANKALRFTESHAWASGTTNVFRNAKCALLL